jgi:XTP/dITP diphosphohydrolase
MRLVLASNNAKKLAELGALFAPLGLNLVAQNALGIEEAEEPHATFLENALAKARHAAERTGCAAIADDSGLCVDALDGGPGVRSAVFAAWSGPALEDREAHRRIQDDANNRLLLERLAGAADRRARYVSTLVAVRAVDDPEPLVATGRWHGEILGAPQGAGGFRLRPADAHPCARPHSRDAEHRAKNQHSHRAIAARSMLALMREVWHLG